jgi:hypothetical protein
VAGFFLTFSMSVPQGTPDQLYFRSVVGFLWGDSMESRQALVDWIEPEFRLFQVLTLASYRALEARDIPLGDLLPMLQFWRRRRGGLAFSSTSLEPAYWRFGEFPQSPEGLCYLGQVEYQSLPARSKLRYLPRQAIPDLFKTLNQALLAPTKQIPSTSPLDFPPSYPPSFRLLSEAARIYARPDLLLDTLEEHRPSLLAYPEITLPCLLPVGSAVMDLAQVNQLPPGLTGETLLCRLQQELQHYPQEVRKELSFLPACVSSSFSH